MRIARLSPLLGLLAALCASSATAGNPQIKSARLTYLEASETSRYKAEISVVSGARVASAKITADTGGTVTRKAKNARLECVENDKPPIVKTAEVTIDETFKGSTSQTSFAVVEVKIKGDKYEGRLKIPSVGGGKVHMTRKTVQSDSCPGAPKTYETAFDLEAPPTPEIDLKFTGSLSRDKPKTVNGSIKTEGYDLAWEIELL